MPHRLREILLGLAVGIFLVLPASADGGTIASVRAWQMTCSGTAHPLTQGVTGLIPKNGFKLVGNGAAYWLGGADVNTTTLGFPYADGATEAMDGNPAAVWCISTGSATMTVLAGRF